MFSRKRTFWRWTVGIFSVINAAAIITGFFRVDSSGLATFVVPLVWVESRYSAQSFNEIRDEVKRIGRLPESERLEKDKHIESFAREIFARRFKLPENYKEWVGYVHANLSSRLIEPGGDALYYFCLDKGPLRMVFQTGVFLVEPATIGAQRCAAITTKANMLPGAISRYWLFADKHEPITTIIGPGLKGVNVSDGSIKYMLATVILYALAFNASFLFMWMGNEIDNIGDSGIWGIASLTVNFAGLFFIGWFFYQFFIGAEWIPAAANLLVGFDPVKSVSQLCSELQCSHAELWAQGG